LFYMRNKTKLMRFLSIFLCAFITVGCSSFDGLSNFGNTNQNYDASNQSNADLLGDMPLPNGARILNENTMMIGRGSGWIGKVYLSGLQKPDEVYGFFLEDFPKAGWTQLSATKSKSNNLLVFSKENRICTIEITEGSFAGPKSLISISASPKPAASSATSVTVPK